MRGGRRREGKDRTLSNGILRNALTGKILYIKKNISIKMYTVRFIAFIGVAASDSGSGTGTIDAKDECGSANS